MFENTLKQDEIVRSKIKLLVESIIPLDDLEYQHKIFTADWIGSGADLFRIAKPATPDPHLVAYFLVFDPDTKKILLTDHKKSGLWLPTGGHVEQNELPDETVERELKEELGLEARFVSRCPVFLTVTKTVGSTAGHTDVSLWYLIKGNSAENIQFNEEEFHQVQWFDVSNIPYHRTDPHMHRCVTKLFQNYS